MEETVVTSFAALHEKVQALDSKFAIFRGVTNADYSLLTTAGRMKIREEFKLRDIGIKGDKGVGSLFSALGSWGNRFKLD